MRQKIHKFFAFAAMALGCALAPKAAHAACPAIPYVFTDNISVVAALSTNTNNTTLRSCATNVDNTQVGSNGFFASQILPTTVGQATFGGVQAYTFPSAGIIDLGNVTAVQGIFSSGVSATTGVFSLGLSTNSALSVNLGALFGAAANTSSVAIASPFTSLYPTISNSTDAGLNLQWGAGSTTGGRFYKYDGTTATLLMQLDNNGRLSLNGSGYVAPSYTFAGAATPATTHHLNGTVAGTITAACTTGTNCAFTGTVTFAGNAAFATSSSYNCTLTSALDQNGSYPGVIWGGLRTSGTSFTYTVTNGGTATIANATVLYANLICDGY